MLIDVNHLSDFDIAKHLVEISHQVDIESAFVMLHKIFQGYKLRFIESLAIQKLKSPLYVQKRLALTLNLTW